jgi:hypothetical protein
MNLGQQDSVTHLVPAFTRLSKLESMMIDDDLVGRDKLVTSEDCKRSSGFAAIA